MNWIVVAGFAGLFLLVLAWYLSSTAGRLDRLHRKIDTSRLALDAQLLRRSSVALELSSSGVLDPASSLVLADAAHRARTTSDEDDATRSRAESDLTAALDAALEYPEDVAEVRASDVGAELLDELDAAIRRVELSRRFLNDAVRACRQLRGQRAARWFWLAGRTALPQSWEMDDTPPAGLGAR
ncbi:MAG: hypothetical protein F2793_01445 [Actinobacteria bacterium]|uniref:Unannotated protein n=1 Tax=freshwater metagenome TaxID=449393 RepID=A0A6J7CX82_9ZZZZ|nr:hypothetical protein [Actinomycetota bacterium]